MQDDFEFIESEDLDEDKGLSEIISDLDENQFKAVTSELKDTLCVSIAGSGKTRVLTRRVAYLIKNGIAEEEIMLLTFTNKAANEMLYRVKSILKKEQLKILGGTFHSVANTFLRKYATEIGYKPNFTILSPDDCENYISEIREEYLSTYKIAKSDFPKAKVLHSLYSSSVNLGKTVSEVAQEEQALDSVNLFNVNQIIKRYNEKKFESNAMDFDDLLVNFDRLLDDDIIRDEINNQYKYVLVDEYQDINHIQYDIIEKLNGNNHHLFVVGDANQSIYSWRGSKVEFIQNFKKTHNCNVFTINKNYRSDGNILKLAEECINYNPQNEPVSMVPHKTSKSKPIVISYQNEDSLSDMTAFRIKGLIDSGVSPKEICILVRGTFLTVKPLENALRRYGVNYILKAGYSYFEREQIKDLISFLTLLKNPVCERSFRRSLGLFEGVGAKTIDKIYKYYISIMGEFEDLIDDVNNGTFKVKDKVKPHVIKFCKIMLALKAETEIDKMFKIVLDNFYDEYLKNNAENYKERLDEIMFLLGTAKAYTDLEEFLTAISLETEDEDDKSKKKNPDTCITISTMHRAKGLEWDYVFIAYANDEIFPSKRALLYGSKEQLEEERRLMYVAMTRAKKQLEISYVRFMNFNKERYEPSMFVSELNPSLYQKM